MSLSLKKICSVMSLSLVMATMLFVPILSFASAAATDDTATAWIDESFAPSAGSVPTVADIVAFVKNLGLAWGTGAFYLLTTFGAIFVVLFALYKGWRWLVRKGQQAGTPGGRGSM